MLYFHDCLKVDFAKLDNFEEFIISLTMASFSIENFGKSSKVSAGAAKIACFLGLKAKFECQWTWNCEREYQILFENEVVQSGHFTFVVLCITEKFRQLSWVTILGS